MLSASLYMDKETELNIEEVNNRFCLNLTKMFGYDLRIVGTRETFERIYEILESNLYEYSYRELEEQLVNKELLLEQAHDKIQSLEDRIEFLQRG
ncbi:hypothetical protein [Clostridium botulinum]|uniref:hypothetical protein n=1 Tax=Clostridium botulinum TaxID=1491 RepID=UPI000773ECB6|nr:hypothetical protein [Clostridium botulinum]MBN3385897.1 hypothetical protein [Clostridium botulinum]MBN3389144.1 hypothetical protein [Clostridium botulinum]MBN3429771.1 hypothetical protein [Clostridium botulinum]MBN3445057.1 hypothetical protein [Clostridium botulinum]NFA36785.1 hypothetical protein [Clostridium botulinum]